MWTNWKEGGWKEECGGKETCGGNSISQKNQSAIEGIVFYSKILKVLQVL